MRAILAAALIAFAPGAWAQATVAQLYQYAAALGNLVARLWVPTIERPVVAPKLCAAEVVFAGEKLVLVRAGSRSVTIPWRDAPLQRGDVLQVGISAHGQPKLVVMTAPDGRVTVIDF